MVMQLPADIEIKLRERVNTGRYDDENAVLRAALAALEAQEEDAKFQRARALIAAGFAGEDAGELTPELWDEINRKVDDAFARGDTPSPRVCP